jgi:replicative DNA helicase
MTTLPKIIPMLPSVPLNETAEKAAISCILQNFECLRVMSWPEELFFSEAHKIILTTAKELAETGMATDPFAVQSRLEAKGQLDAIGGMHGFTELMDFMPTGDAKTAAWHRSALMDAARYRRALSAVREAEGAFLRQEGDIAGVSLALSEAAMMVDRPRVSTKDLLLKLTEELENHTPAEAFGTGIERLDRWTNGGVKRGELLTIGAPTSGGKSILLLQMAVQAVLAGKKVAVFSLEMPATQVLARMVSHLAGYNVGVFRIAGAKGAVNKDMLAKFNSASGLISQSGLVVESGFTDMESIDASARDLAGKGEADFVIVDYVQLVHLRAMASNETREQHVSEITRRLKALALQLNIAVATASQLNEDGKLRESRAIGMHSDHVWMIRHGDESFISLDKNRDGERGHAVPVQMDGAIAKFTQQQDS